jgi:hypothetical protein
VEHVYHAQPLFWSSHSSVLGLITPIKQLQTTACASAAPATSSSSHGLLQYRTGNLLDMCWTL